MPEQSDKKVMVHPGESFFVDRKWLWQILLLGLSLSMTFEGLGQIRPAVSSATSTRTSGILVNTAPPPPVIAAATDITDVSFSAAWVASTGATGYFLDVSTVSNFLSFVTGFNNIPVGNVTSYSVSSNLTANTTYYYRVRAFNANGTSASSSGGTVITAPPAPLMQAATLVDDISFNANWSLSPAATGYFLDVSTVSDFSSFVPENSNLPVGNVNTYSVNTNLSANTLYFYRVRAANSNGTSLSSGTSSVTTAPAAPTVSGSNVTDLSFNANWSASAGASGYFLDVSEVSNFQTFVSGYDNLSVGNATTYPVSNNLSANTTYFFRVRATGTNGTSHSSVADSIKTAPPPPAPKPATGIGANFFSANWSASPSATGYFLDLSTTSDFSSFVSGYQNLNVGNVTTVLLNTNLAANTTYYYRLRSFSASGTSNHSSFISVLTLPAAPTATSATAISQTEFAANWNPLSGISSFKLDVSTDDFVTRLPGYDNASVTGISSMVTGLTSGLTYKYRLRAVNNTGPSANSNSITVVTVPPDPQALGASGTTQTGFTANWSAAPGAGGYLLDVSPASDFSSFLPNYNAKDLGSVLSENITGLNNATRYYYRLKAYNNSGLGISSYSNVISQITIPATPVLLPTDNNLRTTTSFVAQWLEVAGVDYYELTVTTLADVVVPGYPITIMAPAVVANVLNLPAGGLLKYRLRAINAGGITPYSQEQLVQLSNVSLTPPGVTVDEAHSSVSSVKINLTGDSVLRPFKLTFKHRAITASTFTAEAPVTLSQLPSGSSQTIDAAWTDELGIEYYFVLRDAANQVDSTGVNYAYKSFASRNIDGFDSGFTGAADSYKMFSIPVQFTSNRIDEIFQPVISQFGGYDKSKWRLFHFNNSKGGYDEYLSGITTIDEGVGYWFNASQTPTSLSITAPVIHANQSSPFQMTLGKGWNQIGNPYPFNIDWSGIQNANSSAGLNSLWLFESGQYVSKSVLPSWRGAFVFSDQGGTITFPVTTRTTAAGRVAVQPLTATLDDNQWQVPLTLTFQDMVQTSAIGMHPGASASKDRYDEITVPRFIDYLEMNSFHPDFFAPYFSKDVVPTARRFEWTFELESSQPHGAATLAWDALSLNKNQAALLLIDLTAQSWVDMKENARYTFDWSEGRRIKLVYSKDGIADPQVTMLGQSYPNPFTGSVSIPVLVESGNLTLQINVYDMLGRKVKTIVQEFTTPGSQLMYWDGKDDNGNDVAAGMLIYKIMNATGQPAKRMIRK